MEKNNFSEKTGDDRQQSILEKQKKLEQLEAELANIAVSVRGYQPKTANNYEEGEIIIEDRPSSIYKEGEIIIEEPSVGAGGYEEGEIIIEDRPPQQLPPDLAELLRQLKEKIPESNRVTTPGAVASTREVANVLRRQAAETISVFDRMRERTSLRSLVTSCVSLICLVGVLVIGIAYSPLIYKKQPLPYEIENLPDRFMRAGKEDNVEAIDNMLSRERKSGDSQQQIAYILQRNRLFENYSRSEINKDDVRYYIKDDLICCDVKGIFFYDSGVTRNFTVTFVKEYNEWKLYDILIR